MKQVLRGQWRQAQRHVPARPSSTRARSSTSTSSSSCMDRARAAVARSTAGSRQTRRTSCKAVGTIQEVPDPKALHQRRVPRGASTTTRSSRPSPTRSDPTVARGTARRAPVDDQWTAMTIELPEEGREDRRRPRPPPRSGSSPRCWPRSSAGGEAAVRDYARKLDRWTGDIVVTPAEIERRTARRPGTSVKRDIEFATAQVRRFALGAARSRSGSSRSRSHPGLRRRAAADPGQRRRLLRADRPLRAHRLGLHERSPPPRPPACRPSSPARRRSAARASTRTCCTR